MRTRWPKRTEVKGLTQMPTEGLSQYSLRVRRAVCVSLIYALTGTGLAQKNLDHQVRLHAAVEASWSPRLLRQPFVPDPIFVYNNWSSYDELSDNVPLTEKLAMKELDELARLRRFGVRFDYYMVDAFWFAQDGGYKTWRK